jgi:hypothetical protein
VRGAERLPRRPPGVPSGEASQRGAAERRPGLCFSLADASWWRHGCGGGNLDEREGSNQLPRRAAELRRAGVDQGREGQPGWTVFERYRPPLGSLRAVGSNTCVPDRAWAAVSDPVVQVRRARERGATQIERRRCLCRSSSPVEDTGKLAASAFKTRDGRRLRGMRASASWYLVATATASGQLIDGGGLKPQSQVTASQVYGLELNVM